MSSSAADSAGPLQEVARLHELITGFHIFIYFRPEAPEEYGKLGLTGWSGYFASRTAAMGPLSTEMVIATFYNFSPTRVRRAMDGVWERVSPAEVQAARWTAAGRVLADRVAPVVNDDDLADALRIMETSVDRLDLSGRPLAAGNVAVLDQCPDNPLLRLWQLATIFREWRGDAHIGLLVAEPLSGVECSVVSHARDRGKGIVKGTRGWSDDEWDETVASLRSRGLVAAEDALTDRGLEWRNDIEHRTNELSAAIWADHDDATIAGLADVLKPMVKALRA